MSASNTNSLGDYIIKKIDDLSVLIEKHGINVTGQLKKDIQFEVRAWCYSSFLRGYFTGLHDIDEKDKEFILKNVSENLLDDITNMKG